MFRRYLVFRVDDETRRVLETAVTELRAIRLALAAERVTPEMEQRLQKLIDRVNRIDPDKEKR